MKIQIIAVGQKMPAWIQAGYQEYIKRLAAEYHIELIEIRTPIRDKNSNIEKLIHEEGEKILTKVPSRHHIIALDERGKLWNTIELSQEIQQWRMQGSDISLLIGGPDGLSSACLQKAHQQWSLSRLTLPHPLVRVIIAEQLYRATSILAGHPYHRA